MHFTNNFKLLNQVAVKMKLHCRLHFLLIFSFNYVLAGEEPQTGDNEILEYTEEDRRRSLILNNNDGMYEYPINAYGEKGSYTFTKSFWIYSVGFCPTKEKLTGKYENCVIPSSINSCSSPVEPYIRPLHDKKGYEISCSNGRGKLYMFGFKPCTRPYRWSKYVNEGYIALALENRKIIYKICYDHAIEEVLYIFRKFLAPYILDTTFADEEKKTTYKPRTNDFNLFKKKFAKTKPFFSEELLAKTGETMQYIVPPDDLAFAVWKRAAYHFINVKRVLKKTAILLDHVSRCIRQKAIYRFGHVRIVDGFKPAGKDVNVWWKLVYSSGKRSAIAIIIHNVERELYHDEKLCPESICEENNWKGLIPDDMKTHAYCCSSDVITKDITDLPIANNVLNPQSWFQRYFRSKRDYDYFWCIFK